MILKRRDGDLCTAYRPQTFDDMVGQKTIVAGLKQAVKNEDRSHCYLFGGEIGCGKTTAARIFGMSLNCLNKDQNSNPCCKCPNCLGIANKKFVDFKEINASSKNGVNDIRSLEQEFSMMPLFGKVKIYLFDEAHRLTPEAQAALLTNIEEPPKNLYFIFCSTDPEKLIAALRSRCEKYTFKPLSVNEAKYLVETVSVLENFYPPQDILWEVVRSSENKPRNALKLLQQAIDLNNEFGKVTVKDIQEIASVLTVEDKGVIDLCKLLSSKRPYSWDNLMHLYKSVQMDPETTRVIIAGWFRSYLERSKSADEASFSANMLELFVYDTPYIKPENKLVLTLYKAFILSNGRK